MTVPWMIAFGSLAATVVLLGILEVGTLRRVTAVLERAEEALRYRIIAPEIGGVAVGTSLPSFEVEDAEARRLISTQLLEKPTIFLLMDSSCAPCSQLAANLEASQLSLEPRLVVIIDRAGNDSYVAALPAATVVYRFDDGPFDAFESRATPHAFAVDQDGIVRGRVVPNAPDDLISLAESLSRTRTSTRNGSAAMTGSAVAEEALHPVPAGADGSVREGR